MGNEFAAVQGPGAVKETAKEILGRPEFAEPTDNWWDIIIFVLTDPIGALTYAFFWAMSYLPEGTAGSIIAWAVAVLAAVFVIWALIRFTSSIKSDADAPVTYAPVTGEKSASDLDAEAAVHEAAGEWRSAIRSRYGALIARLDDMGIVERRSGRTTGEYLREVSANAPHAAVAFGQATELFEWVWYGDGEPGSSDADRFKQLASDTGTQVKS